MGSGSCRFRLWAPFAKAVSVEVYSPSCRQVNLLEAGDGYWTGKVEGVEPGARYKYNLGDEHWFPDPASASQPDGVHAASEVVSHEFPWSDDGWRGLALDDLVIYELHVGTFTSEGTFDSAIGQLHYLKELGITAVEVMPVAQFPGTRNWGYDGVYPFAVQHSYGGAEGFKRFVDAAHSLGLAVILDVVYNHLGPEGNYLSNFGPYFTDRYLTPWGQAINFDGPESLGVRDYFIQNALYFVREFHIDGLRLDAIHAIHDSSSPHILQEIATEVHSFASEHKRIVNVIAESDLNEARIVRGPELGGYGLDAQWSDDFHHAVHAVLTGERGGYYEDFGSIGDIAKALSDGFVYSGQFSRHRGRSHGTDASELPGHAFVVCVQNHDQIGNRMLGERLSNLASLEDLKLAAGILLISPFVPLLFMGEEYAETAPFLYFVSHSDPALVQAVRQGRTNEFASFSWRGEVPDPESEVTFFRSKLDHSLREDSNHAVMLEWYRTLLRTRRESQVLRNLNRKTTTVEIVGSGQTIAVRRWNEGNEVLGVLHLGMEDETVDIEAVRQSWSKLLDSADTKWQGPGSSVPSRVQTLKRLRLCARQFVLLKCEDLT
jgi:maltooligosyltrehalose trehalohydrolase